MRNSVNGRRARLGTSILVSDVVFAPAIGILAIIPGTVVSTIRMKCVLFGAKINISLREKINKMAYAGGGGAATAQQAWYDL